MCVGQGLLRRVRRVGGANVAERTEAQNCLVSLNLISIDGCTPGALKLTTSSRLLCLSKPITSKD